MFGRRFIPLRDMAERGVLMPLQGLRPLLLSEYVIRRSFSFWRLALFHGLIGQMTLVFLQGIIHVVYPNEVVRLLKIIKLIRTESVPQFQEFFQVFGL